MAVGEAQILSSPPPPTPEVSERITAEWKQLVAFQKMGYRPYREEHIAAPAETE
jgi:hypothetical protein